jgi:hypothetical protein
MVTAKVIDLGITLDRVRVLVQFDTENGVDQEKTYLFPSHTPAGVAIQRIQQDVDEQNMREASNALMTELMSYQLNATPIYPTGVEVPVDQSGQTPTETTLAGRPA